MTNPSKAKGSKFEREVADFLATHGHPHAERAYGAGRPADVGDIDGIPGFVLEVKNHKRLALADWADEAEREADNAHGTPLPVVVAKRPRRPVGDAYVVMSLRDWAALVSETEGATR